MLAAGAVPALCAVADAELPRVPERDVCCEQMEQFLRCVQLPMLSILQREQERDALRTDGAGSRPLSQTK